MSFAVHEQLFRNNKYLIIRTVGGTTHGRVNGVTSWETGISVDNQDAAWHGHSQWQMSANTMGLISGTMIGKGFSINQSINKQKQDKKKKGLFFLFKHLFLLYFMYMSVLPTCVCISHSWSTHRRQKRVSDPWNWSYWQLLAPLWCWDPNLIHFSSPDISSYF